MVRIASSAAYEPHSTYPPMHGYRGQESVVAAAPPRGLTVAVSRQAGARGGRVAKRVGQLLGWQVFDQEMLGYLVQNETAKAEVLAGVPAEGLAWANREHARQLEARHLVGGDQTELLRLAFVLAAKGEVVIVGRGVGDLLPPSTTINVRVIAPLAQRIAYFGEWLRMAPDEAALEVAARDRVRSALQIALVGSDPDDLAQYDLIVNSGRLCEAECADLIAQAVRAKQFLPDSSDPFLPKTGEFEPV